jgi:hypothetical protein
MRPTTAAPIAIRVVADRGVKVHFDEYVPSSVTRGGDEDGDEDEIFAS